MTDVVGKFPSLISAITFSILVAAFIHELAFYTVVGSQYQSLLSVTDYFTSAVTWLPWAAIASIVGLLASFTSPSRHTPEAFYKKRRLRWYVDHGFYVLFFASLILAGAIQFFLGNWYARPSAMEFLFMFVWISFVSSWLRHEKAVANEEVKRFDPPVSLILATMGIPVAMVVIFIHGAGEGAQALTKREPVNFVKFKGDDMEVQVFVLRSLASGAILRRLNGERVEYVKWDDVTMFQSKPDPLNKKGLICRWTGYACNTGLYQ